MYEKVVRTDRPDPTKLSRASTSMSPVTSINSVMVVPPNILEYSSPIQTLKLLTYTIKYQV